MMGIIDYDLGNVKSVLNALRISGIDAVLTDDIEKLELCDAIILPGVGAFATGMNNLRNKGLDKFLIDYSQSNRPILGICLGMQLLFESSEEFGEHLGLGLISGRIVDMSKMTSKESKPRLPHVGWCSLDINKQGNPPPFLLSSFDSGQKFYFVHSYAALANDSFDVAAWAKYNDIEFPAVIAKRNIFGVQFHPEKSGLTGLNLLKQFLDISRGVL